MKYKLAIFDMDGTILNTLDDLADATNYALTEFGYPTHTVEEVRTYIGNGVYNQIRRALPAGTDEETIQRVIAVYKAYYTAHMNVKTAPYAGILDLFRALRAQGVRIGVSSNKFDPAVKALSAEYFGDLVDYAEGESPVTPKKPDPSGVLRIMDMAGASHDETFYVGDSPVDVETAVNAGVDGIFVSWGFRSAQQLCEAGAEKIADTPEMLLKLAEEA